MAGRLQRFLWRLLRHPQPYRATIAQRFSRWAPPPEPYPQYRWCVDAGASLAAKLGHAGITVIEFGVAGGSGLVALEDHADAIAARTGITIDVVGFDSGVGLPAPTDYRDLPYKWSAGYYPMDEARLRGRLRHARLYLGSIAETVERFAAEARYPVGAVMIDVDYYSSTCQALRVFDLARTLPRVPIYFDDLWTNIPFIGEWAAIEEYNATHERQKIARTWAQTQTRGWEALIFEWHGFSHPDYCRPLTTLDEHGQLPLVSQSAARLPTRPVRPPISDHATS